MGPHYSWKGDTLLLSCHVQPGAKRSEVAGLHGGRLKIRLVAPPMDGKANAALIDMVAVAFGVAKTAVSIQRGHGSRQKTLSITRPTLSPADFQIDDGDRIPK